MNQHIKYVGVAREGVIIAAIKVGCDLKTSWEGCMRILMNNFFPRAQVEREVQYPTSVAPPLESRID